MFEAWISLREVFFFLPLVIISSALHLVLLVRYCIELQYFKIWYKPIQGVSNKVNALVTFRDYCPASNLDLRNISKTKLIVMVPILSVLLSFWLRKQWYALHYASITCHCVPIVIRSPKFVMTYNLWYLLQHIPRCIYCLEYLLYIFHHNEIT